MNTERQRGRCLFALGLVAGLFVSGVVVPFAAGSDKTARSAGAALSSGAGAVSPDSPDASGARSGSSDTSGGTAVSSGSPAAAGGATALAPGGTGLRATGRGVSASEVKLGFALLDLRTVNQIGLGGAITGPPPDVVEKYLRFYIDEVNGSGGILGRRIVPAFTTYDPTDQTSARRACLALTEDAKVFAVFVFGGFNGDPILCFTEEHGMPTWEYASEPDSWYKRSRGLLFTASMSGTRNLRSLVDVLNATGALKGKKIGVVSTDSPTEKLPVNEGLVPALTAAGFSIAYRSTISENIDQQPSQIPVEISQMRRAGVDYIIWVSNALVYTQWVQTAANQGYNPPYAMTDINSASNDFTVQNIPASTQAIAVTAIRDGEQHANLPEHPKDHACAARYEHATNEHLDRGGADYQQLVVSCGWIELFTAAAKRAGVDLVPQRLSQAVQSLGAWDFPYFAPGAYSAGKFDLADNVRVKVFDAGCKCWMPKGDLQPGVEH